MPLPVFVPFPGVQSFSVQGKDKLTPPESVWSVIDDRGLPPEAYPRTDLGYVFIHSYTASQVQMGRFGQNAKLALSVIKDIAPNLKIDEKDLPPMDDFLRTTFVMQTPLVHDSDENVSLTKAFKESLKVANQVLRAAGAVRGERFSELNEVNVPGVIFYLKRPAANKEWAEYGIYLTPHMNDLREAFPEPFSEEQMNQLVSHLYAQVHDSPVSHYLNLRAAANRAHFRQGDFRASVILEYAASEFLLDTTLLLMLWEGGVDPDTAAEYFRHPNLGLKKRLLTHYKVLLGGSGWTLEGGSDLARWFNLTARVRGRCVHAGYTPSHVEADKSYEATTGLRGFIAKKLRTKKKKYPLSNAILLGAEKNLQTEIETFGKWRGDVYSKLE